MISEDERTLSEHIMESNKEYDRGYQVGLTDGAKVHDMFPPASQLISRLTWLKEKLRDDELGAYAANKSAIQYLLLHIGSDEVTKLFYEIKR